MGLFTLHNCCVSWSSDRHSLSMKVVFLIQSFLVITVPNSHLEFKELLTKYKMRKTKEIVNYWIKPVKIKNNKQITFLPQTHIF